MMNVTVTFQVMNLVVFVLTAVVAAVGFRRWPEYRGAFMPAALLSAVGVVFYVLLLAGRLNTNEILMWGAALRFLMAMFIFGSVTALAWILSAKHD